MNWTPAARSFAVMTTTVAAAPLTRSIAELSHDDVPYAGGKGANLGELTAAGLPVPDGFVVGAPTYAAFVERTGLREAIAERLRDLDVDDTAALERVAADVRALIETEAVPERHPRRHRERLRARSVQGGAAARSPCARRRPPRTPPPPRSPA